MRSGEVTNFTASLAITEVDKVRKSKESFLVNVFNLHPCPKCSVTSVAHCDFCKLDSSGGALEWMFPARTC